MKDVLRAVLVAACMISADVAGQPTAHPAREAPHPHALGRPQAASMKRAGSTSIDLRRLPRGKVDKRERPEREPPEVTPVELPHAATAGVAPSAPVRETAAPAPGANFAGLDFNTWGSGHPADTNGDAGPTYFIETVNTAVGIFAKSSGALVTAFRFNALMSQGDFGNPCDTDNFGDPVVVYDTFEDRWIIADFAFQLDNGDIAVPPGAFECFAVSKSGDPVAGGWNFYSLETSGGFGDYPKLGIWPDGLYMSVNMADYSISGNFQNVRLYAFDKQRMYAGAPDVQYVAFDAPAAEFTMLPANARLQAGTPPAGSPNYFAVAWQYLNALSVYQLHVDWNRVSTSTLTGPFISYTADNRSQLTGNGVPTPLSTLETLSPRLMAQNQYSNLGGVESLWNSHTVGASGATSTRSGVRYYQIDVTGGTIGADAAQAFTYSPGATLSRFMPSIAVDRAGNLALGYSVSSSSLNPAIRYAGRLAGDAANAITQTETALVAGSGSQIGTDRWGDYSSMTLDPDGCTFWMSNMYYLANGGNWQTRIGAFKYPSCTTVADGTIQGTVTATAGGAPIAGAVVSLGSRTALTDDSGFYSFAAIPAGIYPALAATAAGYDPATTIEINVADAGTTTQDFALAGAAASGCSGDTTQADFQFGVPTGVDLAASAGDALLAQDVATDQHADDNGFDAGYAFDSVSAIGQTFTAGVSGSLVGVDAAIFCAACTGSDPDITLELRATSGGLPDMSAGGLLAAATIPGMSSSTVQTLKFPYATAPALTAGTQYGLVVRLASDRSGGTQGWLASDGSNYSGGKRVNCTPSACSNATGQNGNSDFIFATTVNSGYVGAGVFTSALKDANPAPGDTASWTTLSWNALTPPNTQVRFQAAGSNSPYGPFDFVGPDGTASTSYTTSGGSLSQFDGQRFLRYRAFLATTDVATTPVLADATVCHANTAGATANLSIALSDGVATAVPGTSVTYTMAAANAGPGAAPGSTVHDAFPPELSCTWTCSGSKGGNCTSSGSGDIDDRANLPDGGSVTYVAKCLIAAGATGSLGNTASVAPPAIVSDPDPGDNDASDTDALMPAADLSITDTDGTATAVPGTSTAYAIVAGNGGPSSAPGAHVTATFAAPLDCTWTCSGSGGTCAASGAGDIDDSVDLASGGSVTYAVTCAIPADATGSVATAASVAAPIGVADPASANNTATDDDALAPRADLKVTNSDGMASAVPGATVAYAIDVSNDGPSDAAGATVSDPFPGILSCTWTCSGAGNATCTPSGSGAISESVVLPRGGSVSYAANCSISESATGTLANTASVAAPAGVTDPAASNNSQTDTDALDAQADVAVTLTDNRSLVRLGDVLDYVIEVTNPVGPSTAIVTVTDALPLELLGGTWVCAPSGMANCSNGSGDTLSDTATIPVGAKAAYLFSATVIAAGVNDTVTNSVSAALAGGTDPAPGNDSASDDDTLVIFADGFDAESGLAIRVNAAGTGFVSARLHVNAALVDKLGIVPAEIASGRSADGRRLFALQLARFGASIALRTVTSAGGATSVSAWHAIDLQARLVRFAWQSSLDGYAPGYFSADAGAGVVASTASTAREPLQRIVVTVQDGIPWVIAVSE